MSDPKMTGLALMAISTAALVGTTSSKPAPNHLLIGAGAFRGGLDPVRANRSHCNLAGGKAGSTALSIRLFVRTDTSRRTLSVRLLGEAPWSIISSRKAAMRTWSHRIPHHAPRREFIEVDQPGSEFVVETDVSFPVEIQSDCGPGEPADQNSIDS